MIASPPLAIFLVLPALLPVVQELTAWILENFMLNQSGVHESEWRWIGGSIDHFIDNEGTLEDLKKNMIKKLELSYGSSTIEELQ